MNPFFAFVYSFYLLILSLFGVKNDKKVDTEPEIVEKQPEPQKKFNKDEIAKNKAKVLERMQQKPEPKPKMEQLQGNDNDQDDNVDQDGQEGQEEGPDMNFVGIGNKKQQKMRMKQQQKEYHEQQKLAKEEKRQKEEATWAKIEEKRATKEMEQKIKEEEEKKIKEEKDKEEYDKWRHLFTVDAQGELGDQDFNTNPQLLNDFVGFIKSQKVVVLEELAAKFSLKTQDVIDRIKSLEKDGYICGITDDRGKFIYLTKEEMDSVVDFIQQRGRVSIAEVSQESNKLIKLEPIEDNVDLKDIINQEGNVE